MLSLGIYMIVRNEENKIINSIQSFIDVADEIVILDTGSSDETLNKIKELHSSKIRTYHYKWDYNFANARNKALSLVDSDYIMVMDADETIDDELKQILLNYKAANFYGHDYIMVRRMNIDSNDSSLRYDRCIVKNGPEIVWDFCVHEKLNTPYTDIFYLDKGLIIHKHEVSVKDNFNKYAQIYYNDLNNPQESYKNSHYYYYLYYTLKDKDKLLAYESLKNCFDYLKLDHEEDWRYLLKDSISTDIWALFLLFSFTEPSINLGDYLMTQLENNKDDISPTNYFIRDYFINNQDVSRPYQVQMAYENIILDEYSKDIEKYLKYSDDFFKKFPSNKYATYNNTFNNTLLRPFIDNTTLIIYENSFAPSLIYYANKVFSHIVVVNEGDFEYHLPSKKFIRVNSVKEALKISRKNVIKLVPNKDIFVQEFFEMVKDCLSGRQCNIANVFENPKIAFTLICRLENKYIKEYVHYYENLGVSKFFIYDNNLEGEDDMNAELQKEIESGLVEIIPFTNIDGNPQKLAYQLSYNLHKDEYDWLGFFDADEYIQICSGNDLRWFLSLDKFKDALGISIPNVHYSDSEIIVNNTKNRVNVYNVPSRNICRFYKSIIRGHNNVSFFNSNVDGTHFPMVSDKPIKGLVDSDGNPIKEEGEKIFNYNPVFTSTYCETAFIKHIPTGCIDDFIHMKAKRGWPNKKDPGTPKNGFNLEYFYYYNEKSPKKEKYWNDNMKKEDN